MSQHAEIIEKLHNYDTEFYLILLAAKFSVTNQYIKWCNNETNT